MSEVRRTDPPPGYRVCDMPDGPFTAPLGPLFIREDGAGFAFRATERHCNARGVMHGGMLMTFAERVVLTASGLWKRLQLRPDSAAPARQN